MDGTVLLTALVLMVVGGAFLFAGYRLFRLLAPIWGFLVGFNLVVVVGRGILHAPPLASGSGWLLAVVGGLIFAALAYGYYYLSVVILGASVGYTLGQTVTATLFAHADGSALAGALIGAVALAAVVIAFDLPKALIVVLTALGGASAAVIGVMLMFGWVSLTTLQASMSAGGAGIAAFAPGWVTLLTLGLALAGILVQAGRLRVAPYTHAYAQRRASYPPQWPRPNA